MIPNARSVLARPMTWLLFSVAFVAICLSITGARIAQGQTSCADPHCTYLPAMAALSSSTPPLERTPIPTPTLIPRQNNVYVHSVRTYHDQDAIFVWGEIVNGTDRFVWQPNIAIRLADNDRVPVVLTTTRGIMPTLNPGERSPFAIRVYPAPFVIREDKTEYFVSWREDTLSDSLVRLSVLDWHLDESDLGWPIFYTTLLNETDNIVEPREATLVYYAADGSVEFVASQSFPDCITCEAIQPYEQGEFVQRFDFWSEIWKTLDLDPSRAVPYVWGTAK